MQSILDQAIQLFQFKAWSEAEKLFLMILAKDAQNGTVLHYLGLLKVQTQDQVTAEHYLQQASLCSGNHSDVFNNLGLIQYQLKKYQNAAQSFNQALKLQPDFAQAYYNQGNNFQALGKFKAAIKSYKLALKYNPELLQVHKNLGIIYQELGQIQLALKYFKVALEQLPINHPEVIQFLFLHQYEANLKASQLTKLYQDWGQQLESSITPLNPSVYKKDKIHLAYLSPDFRDHSAVYLYQALLNNYDKNRFHVTCYSLVNTPDPVTLNYKKMVDNWYDCQSWSDEQISHQIQQDHIDILIDPGVGHTLNNRLSVFAHKPAPIQISLYPTPTGLSRIDYRISDQYLDPPQLSSQQKNIIYHPSLFFCFKPPQTSPHISDLPALKNDYITFGSFNHLAKHNLKLLTHWIKIFHTLPNSRLILKNIAFHSKPIRDYWSKLLESLGMKKERVVLLPPTNSREEHLKAYQSIDIALDTYPYNGMTTSLEALWMGVPVVCLSGDRHFSRVTSGINHLLGLENWIARTPQEYVQLTIQHAQNLPELQILRQKIRRKILKSSLAQSEDYIKELEVIYQKVWDDYLS